MENIEYLIQMAREHKVATSTLSDIMDTLDIESVLSPRLQRLSGSVPHIVGIAYTVEWGLVKKRSDITKSQNSTWIDVRDFLVPDLQSGSNLVYVAGAGEIIDTAALAGGISTTYFDALGFEMLLLGGAIRDYSQIQSLRVPIVASNWIPSDTQGFLKVRSVGGACMINGLRIDTGDVIVSDLTGTVRIPKDLAKLVIERAVDSDTREEELLELARHGISPLVKIEEIGRI